MNFTIHFITNIYLEKAEAFSEILIPAAKRKRIKKYLAKKEKKNQSKTLSVPILLSSSGFT